MNEKTAEYLGQKIFTQKQLAKLGQRLLDALDDDGVEVEIEDKRDNDGDVLSQDAGEGLRDVADGARRMVNLRDELRTELSGTPPDEKDTMHGGARLYYGWEEADKTRKFVASADDTYVCDSPLRIAELMRRGLTGNEAVIYHLVEDWGFSRYDLGGQSDSPCSLDRNEGNIYSAYGNAEEKLQEDD